MKDWFQREITPDDEVLVTAFMSRLAAVPPAAAPRLPGSDVLLVKARLLRQWNSERQVQAPLDAMEPIQIVAGLGAAALLLIWSVPSLLSLIVGING